MEYKIKDRLFDVLREKFNKLAKVETFAFLKESEKKFWPIIFGDYREKMSVKES